VLAQLTAQVLMKRRFAVLYPRGREGEESAALFAAAVERWGGEVVVTAAFSPEATDFRAPIREIRAARPEVIYVPAGVDQMVLLGPQLDFYQAGALILGPSEWSAPKLVEQAGSVMQRAVFVSDVALFPAGWTADFEADWRGANYPPEASALALRSYQATRMAYEAIVGAEEGRRGRRDLAAALGRRLTAREFQAEGPEAFARTVLTIEGEETVPFPAEIFAETWTLVALADSAAAVADSLRGLGALPDSLGGAGVPADSLRFAPDREGSGETF
jgi:ABC-type branched-subunit amino acid transport system substrate-binding protein